MNNEASKIREEIIGRELRKNVEIRTMLEFELALQKQLDPEEESVKIPARTNENGQPLSWKTIKRSEYIEMTQKKFDDIELKIKTLGNL